MLDQDMRDRLTRVEAHQTERGKVTDEKFTEVFIRLDRIDAKADKLIRSNGHLPLVTNAGWTAAGLSTATAIGAILKAMGII